jgi:PAS domain S-box-containing protein
VSWLPNSNSDITIASLGTPRSFEGLSVLSSLGVAWPSMRDAVGRSLGEILRLGPDDPRREAVERVEETVRAVFESGRPRTNVPISGAPPGDRARGWICSYFPVSEVDGRGAGVCALVTDMSDALEREEEMALARDRAEESARRLSLLQEVTAGLSRADGVEEIARVVVERVRVAAGASGSTLRLLERDVLAVTGEAGAPEIQERERAGKILVREQFPASDAVRRREPVWLCSAEEIQARFPNAAAVTSEHGIRAGVAIPLIGHGNVLGVLSMVFSEPHAFEPDERAFLLSVADQCAQALERSQLLDAERAQREAAQRAGGRVARLQAVTAALSRASTAGEVAEVLVTEAMGALRGSSCAVFMLHASAGRLHLAAAVGMADTARDRLATLPVDAPIPVAAVVRLGEPLWLETQEQLVASFPELPRFAPYAARMGALAALPLKVGECVLGAVTFGFDAARAFSPEKRELMTAIAQQCAQALDRARLLDAERAARAGEERTRAILDAIFDNAPLGIALLDRDLRFARVNPMLAEMNGIPAEAHVGRTPRELLPDLPHDEVEASFREILRTGQPRLDVELSGETPAAPGRLRHWVESWYPVRFGGDILGLGILVREVTAELEAQEFQRNVLGIVGHDLRNPLSAITTSAQLLLRQAGGDAAATRLGERILANAERMQRIIAVLVDYARVRGGTGVPLRPRRCDLGEVCRAVAEECEASHPGREVRASGPPDVNGEWDPDRVAQIVANLLSNALDYSPQGRRLSCPGAPRASARRSASRTRKPHPGGDPPVVFEPFRRGELVRPGGKDGLGLGLFIARSIAKAHGGTLEVRSAPGERTVFTLALPLR